MRFVVSDSTLGLPLQSTSWAVVQCSRSAKKLALIAETLSVYKLHAGKNVKNHEENNFLKLFFFPLSSEKCFVSWFIVVCRSVKKYECLVCERSPFTATVGKDEKSYNSITYFNCQKISFKLYGASFAWNFKLDKFPARKNWVMCEWRPGSERNFVKFAWSDRVGKSIFHLVLQFSSTLENRKAFHIIYQF